MHVHSVAMKTHFLLVLVSILARINGKETPVDTEGYRYQSEDVMQTSASSLPIRTHRSIHETYYPYGGGSFISSGGIGGSGFSGGLVGSGGGVGLQGGGLQGGHIGGIGLQGGGLIGGAGLHGGGLIGGIQGGGLQGGLIGGIQGGGLQGGLIGGGGGHIGGIGGAQGGGLIGGGLIQGGGLQGGLIGAGGGYHPGFIGGGGLQGGFIGSGAGLGGGFIGGGGGSSIGLGAGGFGGQLGGAGLIGGGHLVGGGGNFIGGVGGGGGGGEVVDKSSYSGEKKNLNDGSFAKSNGQSGVQQNQGQQGFNQGKVGVQSSQGDLGYYNDQKGQKKLVEDQKHFTGGQQFNQQGQNADEKKLKAGHKKGHVIKGFKTSHHKDETGKTEEYFDEANDEGDNFNFYGRNGHFGEGSQSAYKGGLGDHFFNADERKKQGHYDAGQFLHKNNGDQGEYGQKKYLGSGQTYGVNNGIDQQSLLGHQEHNRFFKQHPFFH